MGYICTASSAPENLRVFDLTTKSFSIEWSSPKQLNGEFEFYEITLESKKFSDLYKTSNTRYDVLQLKHSTDYTISVKVSKKFYTVYF